MIRLFPAAVLFAVLSAAPMAMAATATTQPAAPSAPVPADKLTILFASSSDQVSADGDATLDKASRLYRAGNPIVMIVSGMTDNTGNPAGNLTLSERRARAVLNGLVERGIPIQRLQLLAAGTTDPAVKTGPDTPEAQNRRVDITWR